MCYEGKCKMNKSPLPQKNKPKSKVKIRIWVGTLGSEIADHTLLISKHCISYSYTVLYCRIITINMCINSLQKPRRAWLLKMLIDYWSFWCSFYTLQYSWLGKTCLSEETRTFFDVKLISQKLRHFIMSIIINTLESIVSVSLGKKKIFFLLCPKDNMDIAIFLQSLTLSNNFI